MSNPKLIFPAEIAPQCQQAWADAVAICNANNAPFKAWRGSVIIRPRPGEKRFKNGWAWMHKTWKTWVMAHCAGGPKDFNVKLATDPKDPRKGWRTDTLTHEFCHAILIACHNSRGHDPRLHGKVFGWHADAVGTK
jgi:hypothetical protein